MKWTKKGRTRTEATARAEPAADRSGSTGSTGSAGSQGTAATPAKSETSSKRSGPGRGRRTGAAVSSGLGSAGRVLGRVLRGICVILALFLAVGALLVALRHDVHLGNPVVRFVLDVADHVDGPLSRHHGVFAFHGKSAVTKDAVVNWGLAAIVYLIIGSLLHRLFAGRSSS